jgi:hypothetical protein
MGTLSIIKVQPLGVWKKGRIATITHIGVTLAIHWDASSRLYMFSLQGDDFLLLQKLFAFKELPFSYFLLSIYKIGFENKNGSQRYIGKSGTTYP